MTKYRVFWTGADRTGSMPGGEFDSREEAEASIPAYKAELLGVCADAEQVAGIESGTFTIDEVEDEDEEDRDTTLDDAIAAVHAWTPDSSVRDLRDLLDDVENAITDRRARLEDYVDMTDLPSAEMPDWLDTEHVWSLDNSGELLVGEDARDFAMLSDLAEDEEEDGDEEGDERERWQAKEWLAESQLYEIWPEGQTLAQAVEWIEADLNAKAREIVVEGDIKEALLAKTRRIADDGDPLTDEQRAALVADGYTFKDRTKDARAELMSSVFYETAAFRSTIDPSGDVLLVRQDDGAERRFSFGEDATEARLQLEAPKVLLERGHSQATADATFDNVAGLYFRK